MELKITKKDLTYIHSRAVQYMVDLPIPELKDLSDSQNVRTYCFLKSLESFLNNRLTEEGKSLRLNVSIKE